MADNRDETEKVVVEKTQKQTYLPGVNPVPVPVTPVEVKVTKVEEYVKDVDLTGRQIVKDPEAPSGDNPD